MQTESVGPPSSELVVASQLDAAMNRQIREAVPEVDLVEVGSGFPSELPANAAVFFARPFHGRTEFPPPAAWTKRVKWIQLLSAGADGYPPWYFDGPTVTCSRGPTALPVAEFALAAIFAHAKAMPQAWIHDVAAWTPRMLMPVHGSTLGIVGFGAIGQALAGMGKSLGMRVVVARRQAASAGDAVEVMPLNEVIAAADHLVVAAAATTQTRHLIGRDALQHARPHLHLVNVARGPLLDQDALIEALDNGKLSCATLDVSDPEPLPSGHPLYSHPRVRLSPHISSYDPTLSERIGVGFIENLRRYRLGEPLNNVVNPAKGY